MVLWASLSLCLGTGGQAAQSTSRLTPGKSQGITTTSYTGRRLGVAFNAGIFLFSRCKDEWLVGMKGKHVWLKATVSEDKPDQPPAAGWKFYKRGTGEYEADESITCEADVASTPCSLTVNLSGPAKEVQGECEGEYKSTGLISSGRPVMIFSIFDD